MKQTKMKKIILNIIVKISNKIVKLYKIIILI